MSGNGAKPGCRKIVGALEHDYADTTTVIFCNPQRSKPDPAARNVAFTGCSLRAEGRKKLPPEEPGHGRSARRLVAVQVGLLPRSGDEVRNSGTGRAASVFVSRSGFARRVWHSLRTSSRRLTPTGPSEMRFVRPSASSSRIQLRPPVGRTRTPRPTARVSETVHSRSRGRRRATAASVALQSELLLFTAQPRDDRGTTANECHAQSPLRALTGRHRRKRRRCPSPGLQPRTGCMPTTRGKGCGAASQGHESSTGRRADSRGATIRFHAVRNLRYRRSGRARNLFFHEPATA